MTSKEALENLGQVNLGDNPYCIFEDNLLKNCCKEEYEAIEKDLERLEKLEKCIDILKDNLRIYKRDNYRLSVNGSLEYQEITNQEYELLKELLEDELIKAQ